jgi:hypothetical protein
MIPKPLRPFMARLLDATNDGEIEWKEGADEAYFAIQKDANLHIRYLHDQDTGESAYNFRIVRGGADAFFTVLNEEDDFYFMRNLYSAVSVNASGGEKIVDNLFE